MPQTTDLTAERLRELLAYDPATGIFTWRVRPTTNVRIGEAAGCTSPDGYIRIRIDGVLHLGHRLAWLWTTGEHPPRRLDHEDTDRSNNRWSNLRLATQSENQQNQRTPHSGNASGYLGVWRQARTGKYTARIQVDGHRENLGSHDTPEQAHSAYVAAKRKMHPYGTL